MVSVAAARWRCANINISTLMARELRRHRTTLKTLNLGSAMVAPIFPIEKVGNGKEEKTKKRSSGRARRRQGPNKPPTTPLAFPLKFINDKYIDPENYN